MLFDQYSRRLAFFRLDLVGCKYISRDISLMNLDWGSEIKRAASIRAVRPGGTFRLLREHSSVSQW
jgi:hypothetical protein